MAAGVGSSSQVLFATNPGLAGATKVSKMFRAIEQRLETHYARELTFHMPMTRNSGRYMFIFGEGSPNPANIVPEMSKHTMNSVEMLAQKRYDIQRVVTGYQISYQTYQQWVTSVMGDPLTKAASYCEEAIRLHEENYFVGMLVYAWSTRTVPTNFTNLDTTCSDGVKLFTTAGHTWAGAAGIANINIPASNITPSVDGIRDVDVAFGRFQTDKGSYMDNWAADIVTGRDYLALWMEQVKNQDNPNTANRAVNPVKWVPKFTRTVHLVNQLPNQHTFFRSTLCTSSPEFYNIARVTLGDTITKRVYDEDRECHQYFVSMYMRIMCAYRGEGWFAGLSA